MTDDQRHEKRERSWKDEDSSLEPALKFLKIDVMTEELLKWIQCTMRVYNRFFSTWTPEQKAVETVIYAADRVPSMFQVQQLRRPNLLKSMAKSRINPLVPSYFLRGFLNRESYSTVKRSTNRNLSMKLTLKRCTNPQGASLSLAEKRFSNKSAVPVETSYIRNRLYYDGDRVCYLEIVTMFTQQNDHFNEYLYFRNLIQPFTDFTIRPTDIRTLLGKWGKFNGSAIVRIPGYRDEFSPKRIRLLISYQLEVRRVFPSSSKVFLSPSLKRKEQKEFKVMVTNLPPDCEINYIIETIFNGIAPESIEKISKVEGENWIFQMSSQQAMRRILFYDGEIYDSRRNGISIVPIDESQI